MEVNQLPEWWRKPTHHPWKAGDPQRRQSRNDYPEGFMVSARLWPGEGRTSSGIREIFLYHYLFLSPKDIKGKIGRQSGEVFDRQKDR